MNIPLKISRKTTTHAKDQTRQCEQHLYICKSEQKSQCYNTNKIDLEKKMILLHNICSLFYELHF